jgi:ComF family protein
VTGRLGQALHIGIESLAAALFPPRCGGCGTGSADALRFGLCPDCQALVLQNDGPRCQRCDVPCTEALCERCHPRDPKAAPPAFDALRAPYRYGGPLAEMVLGAKFHGKEELGRALAELILSDPEANRLGHAARAIVPVPLSRARAVRRGYNQAALIARALGRAWHKPVRYALCRTRNTLPQSDLAVDQRHGNVVNGFVATMALSGPVLLVDDVVTSGETVAQAAHALSACGATPVYVVAAARTVG